jgi:soluble lytic murein transglycosylase-like protein
VRQACPPGSAFCVSVPFVQAVMMQESGGNPWTASSAGALGLMQVMPSHVSKGQDALDPATHILAGVEYLDALDRAFQGNLPLVAAGYNAGGGAVAAWAKELGTSAWPVLAQSPVVQAYADGQTYAYVSYVMGYYAYFSALAASQAPPALSRAR